LTMHEMAKKSLPGSRRATRQSESLVQSGLVAPEQLPDIERVLERFSLAITPAMRDLIERGDAADPIARQFVPSAAELVTLAEERADPIGDDSYTAVKGIVHRYPDRVLLKPLHVCPVYCRFCFRREKVGPGGEMLSQLELQTAYSYIRSNPQIWEVILTGGDPLIMTERRMAEIIRSLDAIRHVEVIRIHTRIPVVDPDRITPAMIHALKVDRPVYVVLHCNHPRELTAAARAACARLVDAGIPMLSQSVLLKGVNDNRETMEKLLRALAQARVKPYYLHHGDLAEGTSHFRTSIAAGQRLMRQLRGRLSGICQPTYVLDIPGGFGKVPIGPSYLQGPDADDRYLVSDYRDEVHSYPPVRAAPAGTNGAPNAEHHLQRGNTECHGTRDADFRLLSDQTTAAMERLHVPGVAIGIIHQGKEHAVGFGVTSVEHPLPVDGDTFFQIGSITKTMTATAAMRLVDHCRLDLDVPIRCYLRDLRLADENVARRVTLRHLFTHTGGWLGDLLDDTGAGDDALARMVVQLTDLPQLTPLGKIWSYNNSGLYLAGRVIEIVTGMTYEAAVKQLVLDPLGMNRSSFFSADVITNRFVVGHDIGQEDNLSVVCRPWALARSANPLGGLLSTAREMLRYVRFHLGDGTGPSGERLLTPMSMTLMQSALVEAQGGVEAGLPWWIDKVGSARVVWHEGCTHGQLSTLMMVPEREFAIIVLTNSYRGATLLREITECALREYLGLSNPQPVPLDMPEGDLVEYVGRYASAEEVIDLRLHDWGLLANVLPKGGFPTRQSPPPPSPPPIFYEFYAKDRVVAVNGLNKGERCDFLRDTDGRIVWFRCGLRIHGREEAGNRKGAGVKQ
jgi:lysine 2,3-aminomutase